jgi:hypothetical protein
MSGLRTRSAWLGAVLMLGAPACAPASHGSEAKSAPSEAQPTVDQVEANVIRLINAKDAKGIVALYAPSMLKAFPEDKSLPFWAGIFEEYGRVLESEKIPGVDEPGAALYRAKAERGAMKLVLAIDGAGKITGLVVRPAHDQGAEPPVVRSTLPLALPFRGQWLVFWGGDRLELNHHVAFRGQRRAADLNAVGPDGALRHGDGKKNEDYYTYGREILAVADGTVVTAIDGVPDNIPGSLNPLSVFGNVVILQHADSLFSTYAHLQPGKLRVKVGDKVKQGTVLGLCGNSGNASQPHLHFQLQDGPLLEKSSGIEGVFQNVTVVRQGASSKVGEYTFLKGDVIGEPLAK